MEEAHKDNCSISPSTASEHLIEPKEAEDSDLADATRKTKSWLADLGILADDQSDSESDNEAKSPARNKSKGKTSGRLRTADHKMRLEV